MQDTLQTVRITVCIFGISMQQKMYNLADHILLQLYWDAENQQHGLHQ